MTVKGDNMFTGLIEEIGTIKEIKKGASSAKLTISAKTVLEGSKTGDSIAVNGICLTVTSLTPQTFTADVMHETLNRTSLAGLRAGSRVNLERAMPADGRFGGHFVSGHIDGTGSITSISRDDNAVIYAITAERQILRGIVEKGSVAIDGISLTVVAVNDKTFTVSIIPHTADNTILPDKRPGDPVNLECDIIGKYVDRLLQGGGVSGESPYINGRRAGGQDRSGGSLSAGFLAEMGFL